MLNFEITPTQREWIQKTREFVKQNILDRDDLDRHDHFPLDLYQKAFEQGLITSMIPAQWGGLGLSTIDGLYGAMETAYGDLGFTTSAFLMRLSVTPLLLFGTEQQKEKWVRPLTQQLRFASFGFTEHEGSTNLGSRPASTTVKKVKGGYLINGAKDTISNASVSWFTCVFARFEDQPSGLSCFIVPSESEGVKVGKVYRKMGQRAADTAEIFFENVFVPDDNLVGRVGQGAQIALRSLRQSRVGIGAMAVGVCQRARDLAKEHCHNRQNGQGKPIIYEQNIKFRFAEIEAKIEMLKAFVLRAGWEIDHGKEITKYSSSVKLMAGRIAAEITNECLDLHGGRGYMTENKVEKLVRDAKLLSIYEGTEAVQQLLIADSAIRINRERL